jgi:lipopolysaccharide export system protein LptA
VTHSTHRLAAALLTAALFTSPMASMPAHAQQPALPGIGDPNAPLEIEADNGLELYQDRQLVVAKGNVIATQGEVVLRADILSASYEESGGQRQIRRLDAVGHVRIETGRERLFGDHATYDLVRELMVVTGEGMRIEAEQQTIEADETLEFWGAEQRAVARGNAVVTQDTTSLRADVIEAMLSKGGSGANQGPAAIGVGKGSSVERVRAWGGVTIRTPSEIVEGDEGDYDVVNQVAVLEGNVRISRGKNQLNGHKAIVDLKSGVSRLVGGSGGRVRTILFPGSPDNAEPPDPQQPREPGRQTGPNGSGGSSLPSITQPPKPPVMSAAPFAPPKPAGTAAGGRQSPTESVPLTTIQPQPSLPGAEAGSSTPSEPLPAENGQAAPALPSTPSRPATDGSTAPEAPTPVPETGEEREIPVPRARPEVPGQTNAPIPPTRPAGARA